MEDKTLKRDIESAGGWFVGEYATRIIDNFYNLINDKEYKNKFIKGIFNEQSRDKDYAGTRVRVNSLLRIIKNKKIVEALEYIIASDRINKDDPKAVDMAIDTLRLLKG